MATLPTKDQDSGSNAPAFRRSSAGVAAVRDSWLFERGDSSVRIVRTGTLDLEVLGPGEHRERHAFAADEQIVSFLHRTGEELAASGYRPRGYGIERRAGESPRRDLDRRRAITQ